MFRLSIAFLVIASASSPVAACPGCSGEVRARLTLRLQFAQAKAVIHGQLKNPRFDPKTDEGFTDLQATTILKDDPARNGQGVLVLRSYLPVVGNTPTDFLVFCGVSDGKLDPTTGIPCTLPLIEYLKAAAKLEDKDPVAKLGFFFKHLDSAEATIAADAFVEFARSSDVDIIKAAKQLDPAKLRKLISNPATNIERLGVFSFLLGVSGGPDDSQFLGTLLKESPRSERCAAAFGGLLAGYLLLNPQDGWQFAVSRLSDTKESFSIRLATIGTVRYFQSSRGTDCKAEVLRCCAALLPHADLADQAIEDLRRWGYWDLTADVLAQYAKPTHAAPIVRRCIVRYALCCPDESAKRFVAALKQSDPKLVQTVEDNLELYAPASSTPKKSP